MKENLNTRGRILALLEILTIFTDEYHTLTAEQLCEKLSEYGYDVTKRTVLDDIKVLEQSPYDIVKVSREKGYYIIKTNHAAAVRKILAAAFSSPLVSKEDVEEIKRYLDRNSCVATLNTIYETTESITVRPQKSKIPFDLVQPLRKAIISNKKVEITYSIITPGDGYSEPNGEANITINPFKIVVSSDMHALIFTRPDSTEKTEYINMHRITGVKILEEEQNSSCSDFLDAVSFFNAEPLLPKYKKSVWILLKFKEEYAEKVDDFFSCPVQYKKDSQEGFYLAKVFFPICKELVAWLYHYRNIIEVVSPKGLNDYFNPSEQIS